MPSFCYSAAMCPAATDSADYLHNMRHSLAHVLAQAVMKLWPDTKPTIGPPIDNGCYYDFLFAKPISTEDFGAIEKEMRKIINQGQTFEVDALKVDDAIAFWKEKKQPFKVELVEDLKAKGETKVTNYRNVDAKGQEMFVDLCRGGHVENLKEIPADGFKLMSLAGAYWRGDEKREQLTRIYVVAFPSKEQLQTYLKNLEEAAKVDHRKLGKEMNIFVLSETVGPGLPMLAPKGAVIRQELEGWIRGELKRRGYSFVYTPNIGRADLYKKSGHLSHFKKDIFPLMQAEDAEYVLKPMNCPHHVQVYESRPWSYRELPQRFAEFGTVYRYEQSGEVGGLTRVRGFTQDDAHLFMCPDQMQQEIEGILDLAFYIYKTLGFENFRLRLSLHDPANWEKYIGTKENWKLAEDALRNALEKLKLPYEEAVGESAFYGPKIDLIVKDVFGREWQLGTIPQVDYNMPERFDIWYNDKDGTKKRPVMMHRAIFGSFERFIGVLIEHFKGAFPLWLAPVQVSLVPVAEAHEGYAHDVEAALKAKGMRVTYFESTDSLGKRVRESEKQKIPYVLVLGDKEVEAKSVAVRNTRTGKQEVVSLDQFIAKTAKDVDERNLECSIG
ncbi:threonine--tRNA ligase [Candidatus Peregrinibacteria bacterium]|nr:threonine--tRNA ligase [Candidatus Peregrinibacteria bacterium]